MRRTLTLAGCHLDRRQLLQTGSALLAAAWLPRLEAAEGARKKVLFFTKSSGFQHSVVTRKGEELAHAERVLVELGKTHGFDVEPTKDGRVFDGDLRGYDAFVFYTTGDLTKSGTDKTPPMSARGKQALLDAIHAGKGFVGSHCASDTFHTPGPAFETQDKKDPYIAMIGGEFIRHGAQQKAMMAVVDAKFPGMAVANEGFEMHEEWYSLKNFAPDLHVLLVNETTGMQGKDYQRPRFPATWARHHGDGRVFYTSMGHREDVWTNPVFQSIFVGGIHWATRTVDADIPANIAQVTPAANTLPPA
ncbi:MAG: ThuA domain-containing protein [Pirellulaceae bacterium]